MIPIPPMRRRPPRASSLADVDLLKDVLISGIAPDWVKDGFRSQHCQQIAVPGQRPVQLCECFIVVSDPHINFGC
jgi:hypothetical protein